MLWLDGHYTLRLDHIRDEVATHVAQFDGLHQRPPRSCESSLGTLQCRADPSAAIARFAYCHDPPGLRRTFTCRADRLPLHSAPSWRPLRFSTRPNCPPRRHLSVLASVCCQKPQPHSLHSPPLPPHFRRCGLAFQAAAPTTCDTFIQSEPLRTSADRHCCLVF